MDYDPALLDQLFASGEVIWGRLQPPVLSEDSRGQVLTRVSPISIVRRADVAWLLPPDRDVPISVARWDAQAVHAALAQHGALFFDDLLAATSLLPSQLEDALRELAALGIVTSDGFAAIRALVTKRHPGFAGRRSRAARRERGKAYSRGGRWSRFPPFSLPPLPQGEGRGEGLSNATAPATAPSPNPLLRGEGSTRAEHWAWLLVRRYGVMFRDLLARESLAPAWRELASVYRRLEMRGELRGGRFVAGVAGEQFALPEAVEQLRRMRDEPATETWTVISAADPLNLVGIITSGPRVPATRGNRIAMLNGRPIAARESRAIRWLAGLDESTAQQAQRILTCASTRCIGRHTSKDFPPLKYRQRV
jgi:ATP-dependent Lhr-like helicase